MQKGRKSTGLPPGGGGDFYCYICQKSFVTSGALRMHCRSAKAHREETSAPPSAASSTNELKVLSTNKGHMCKVCDRHFVNKTALWKHKRDSPKHKTPPDASQSVSSNIAQAPASYLNRISEIVRSPEIETDRIPAKEYDNIEESLVNLGDQLPPLSLLRRGLHAPPTSFSKVDPDIENGLRSALAALHTSSDSVVGPRGLPFFEADTDKARADNPVASVSVDRQEESTNPARYEPVVPEVPAPWSAIPLSERGVLLSALQAQCHPIECLAGERYWTQTPSPADVDMTRQCNGCRATKRSISTGRAESVCRFHPERKAFHQGIIRGQVPKTAQCVNCKQLGSSKGCTVLSVHDFAAPDAKLGMMAPTPEYNQSAHKAVVLDCEMVGVLGANGRECSEVVRVSAVDFLSGEVIFDTYVSPNGYVISWRTKFSGVDSFLLSQKKREGKLIKGWRAARDLLWQFIDAQTILIGHSLHHDLAVLGMVHTCVVDSATMTRIAVGEDCQRNWALKTLVRQYLDRDIQTGKGGHDCVEDTYAAREVVLWCLQNTTQLQVWAANERKIIAEKNKERKLLTTRPREVASAS